jgi:hypothetical protein
MSKWSLIQLAIGLGVLNFARQASGIQLCQTFQMVNGTLKSVENGRVIVKNRFFRRWSTGE